MRPLVSLAKHCGWISSLTYSPDNRILASSSWDRTIILWEPQTGALIGRLTNHTAWVGSIAFSPDGRRLFSVSADHSIRLWDAATLQEITRLKGHEHEVFKVAVSPNGELLATGSKDHSVKLWNAILKSGEERTLTLYSEEILSVSGDRRAFLSPKSDGTMRLWNAKDLSLLRAFECADYQPIVPGTLARRPDARFRSTRWTHSCVEHARSEIPREFPGARGRRRSVPVLRGRPHSGHRGERSDGPPVGHGVHEDHPRVHSATLSCQRA
ncbi:MAG: WD40 repeat domain-containing protein [Pedosphaera sp.]|nr:WD40 repeat domain-containing protein [Pedosphaera sp.]